MTIATYTNPWSWAQAPKPSAKPIRKPILNDDVESDVQLQGWWVAKDNLRRTSAPPIDLLVAAAPPLRRYKH